MPLVYKTKARELEVWAGYRVAEFREKYSSNPTILGTFVFEKLIRNDAN